MVRREAWRQSDGRRNVRHLTAMPVRVRTSSGNVSIQTRLRDIGQGGLGLTVSKPIQPGETCVVEFPLLNYPETVRGRVVWCRPETEGYAAGVQFLEDHPYSHARLVVDICHIEYYLRDQRLRNGRELDHASAVEEWRQRQSAFPMS